MDTRRGKTYSDFRKALSEPHMSLLLQLRVSRLRVLQRILLGHHLIGHRHEAGGRAPRSHVSFRPQKHHAPLKIRINVVAKPDPELGMVCIDCSPNRLQKNSCLASEAKGNSKGEGACVWSFQIDVN